MGVWIEILLREIYSRNRIVTPFMGVWIEILKSESKSISFKTSLPLWECGLKLLY